MQIVETQTPRAINPQTQNTRYYRDGVKVAYVIYTGGERTKLLPTYWQ